MDIEEVTLIKIYFSVLTDISALTWISLFQELKTKSQACRKGDGRLSARSGKRKDTKYEHIRRCIGSAQEGIQNAEPEKDVRKYKHEKLRQRKWLPWS